MQNIYIQGTKGIVFSLTQLPNINIKTQPELVGVGMSATRHTVR